MDASVNVSMFLWMRMYIPRHDICLWMCMSINVSMNMCTYLWLCLSMCLSMYIYECACMCLQVVYECVYECIHMSMSVSMNVSICLWVCLHQGCGGWRWPCTLTHEAGRCENQKFLQTPHCLLSQVPHTRGQGAALGHHPHTHTPIILPTDMTLRSPLIHAHNPKFQGHQSMNRSFGRRGR